MSCSTDPCATARGARTCRPRLQPCAREGGAEARCQSANLGEKGSGGPDLATRVRFPRCTSCCNPCARPPIHSVCALTQCRRYITPYNTVLCVDLRARPYAIATRTIKRATSNLAPITQTGCPQRGCCPSTQTIHGYSAERAAPPHPQRSPTVPSQISHAGRPGVDGKVLVQRDCQKGRQVRFAGWAGHHSLEQAQTGGWVPSDRGQTGH